MNLKPIGEHSYTWAEGLMLGDTMLGRLDEMRQIDWDTVKEILDSKKFEKIEVGLAEDYYQTHAIIFKDNELIIKENDGAGFYGASTWATPSVKLTKDGETGLFECWINGEQSKFPDWLEESARRISCWEEYEDYIKLSFYGDLKVITRL